MHSNADPGTPHCVDWFITTVLTVLGTLGLQTGILDEDRLPLELDPWHVSQMAVGMQASCSKSLGHGHPSPDWQRPLPKYFFNAEFNFMVFLTLVRLWLLGQVELQR